MGSKFSKRKQKKPKELARKYTLRNGESIEFINIPKNGSVSTCTFPVPDASTQPEVMYNLSREQSPEALMNEEYCCETMQTQAVVVPRITDSIQSSNFSTYGRVSTYPVSEAYSQPEVNHTLPRSQSPEALKNKGFNYPDPKYTLRRAESTESLSIRKNMSVSTHPVANAYPQPEETHTLRPEQSLEALMNEKCFKTRQTQELVVPKLADSIQSTNFPTYGIV